MNRQLWVLVILLAGSLSLLATQEDKSSRQVEWLYYGGDPGGTRYSPLADITAQNVAKNDGSDPLVAVNYSNVFARGGESASLPGGLPLVSPPYAALTAIDLNKGEIAWKVPLGEGSPAVRNHPLLKGITLPDRLGSPNNLGGAMVTRGGLVFIGGGDRYFYAFDKKTGQEVWRGKIPYATTAVPMTYRTRSGRQFIVVATGTGADNALVAFALR